MDYLSQVYLLSAKFVQDYPAGAYPELMHKQGRPYTCLLIDSHDGYFICVPFRSSIHHKNAYFFKGTARSQRTKSGLDYSKIVIVSDPDYIDSSTAAIVDQGAIHLCRVLSAHGATADSADTTVGIAGQLPARNAAVGKAAADHETSGRIDQLFKVRVQPVLTSGQYHDTLNDMPEIRRVHIQAVLDGAEEGRDLSALIVVADLGFRIGAEHAARMRFQDFQEAGR